MGKPIMLNAFSFGLLRSKSIWARLAAIIFLIFSPPFPMTIPTLSEGTTNLSLMHPGCVILLLLVDTSTLTLSRESGMSLFTIWSDIVVLVRSVNNVTSRSVLKRCLGALFSSSSSSSSKSTQISSSKSSLLFIFVS
ncbi:unnamed protein product [Meganyctiphanes norvegica]|uniref:Uncharacterized protein n=1 Tax=Meganyctiphanes norvegica TaxID=48144 RepID=A0AAV2PVX0_MEGNR